MATAVRQITVIESSNSSEKELRQLRKNRLIKALSRSKIGVRGFLLGLNTKTRKKGNRIKITFCLIGISFEFEKSFLFQGKEKNIICTTEQLEEFLQQRNDIILDEVTI